MTSLLELGAGFSPDLSGRENIYLNASLHGLTRAATDRVFDAIVDFAELTRFIDMPVRNYSSGMYMRLGIAVAVHLDPEIVLIDEAFAVGDEAFQRKCLRKMKEFQARGLTIVLVSHDLLLVERIATRACLLMKGEVAAEGRPADVIARYHQLAAAEGRSPARSGGAPARSRSPPSRSKTARGARSPRCGRAKGSPWPCTTRPHDGSSTPSSVSRSTATTGCT